MDSNNIIIITSKNVELGKNYTLLPLTNQDEIKISTYPNSKIKCYQEKSDRLCIIGHPFYGEKIDNNKFAERYFLLDENNKNLTNINGEFLLIETKQNADYLRIVNCRFGSPIFWYYAHRNIFIGSTSYYHLALLLKKNNLFKINRMAFYEFINYRRLFDEKTYDLGAKYLKPASTLTYSGNNLDVKRYWSISYQNNQCSFDANVNNFIHSLKRSIKRKTSDNKKFGLMLSGGMDTRTILAAFDDSPPHCFNLTYSKNSREYKVAKVLTNSINADFSWIKIDNEHESKYLNESIKTTGGMYMTPSLFLGHSAQIQGSVDTILAGYGFDYFFQGMYLPMKDYKIIHPGIWIRRLHKIKGSIAEHFINHISYKTRGFPVQNLIKNKIRSELHEQFYNTITSIIEQASSLTDNIYRIWEHISLGDLSRHITYGGQLELMTLSEYRGIAYDNDLYELYSSLPTLHRYDAKIMRRALKIMNPLFYNHISANSGHPIKYSTNIRLLYRILDGIKKITGIQKRTPFSENNFTRTWLPIEYVLRNQMMKNVISLKDSSEIDSLNIIDMDELRKNIDLWAEGKIIGDQTFFVLLIIDNLIKSI